MFDFIINCNQEQNVTEEYINELEAKRNIKFPKILRNLYLQYNKSNIEEISFSIHNLEFSVEFLIPLKYGNVNVEKILSFNDSNEFVPKTFIPFAEDVDGEDFYWDLADGKVYYLSMGNVENPIPVADSIDEFFELLNKNIG